MQIYFSTSEEEEFHQALVLVGDKKAVAINHLRLWDGFYSVKLQTVVDYVLNYIDECQKEGAKIAYERHCKKITTIYTSTLPKGFWNLIRDLADIPDRPIIYQLALVPFMRQQFGDHHD